VSVGGIEGKWPCECGKDGGSTPSNHAPAVPWKGVQDSTPDDQGQT